MTDVPVIKIDAISKHFVIRKEKSLKERIVNFGRSQKHKEDFWALRNVSATINSGSTVGLIGPNGSGKSTLLKMIGGILQPNQGSVLVRGRIAALLELGAGFHPDLTGRENIYLNAALLGLSKEETDRHLDSIIDFSGIEAFIDTQVKFYSSGMYVRLAFAVAVHVDPDILLVDEVLAVGDEPFQRKCLERIRQFQSEGRTIVLVSHSLEQVAQFCDRAIVLEQGTVVADGPAIDALRVLRADFESARQDELERAESALPEEERGPRARFESITLRSDSGATGDIELWPGDGFTVVMTVDAEDYLARGWSLGVTISTSLGNVLFTTDSERLDTPPPALIGRGVYEYHLGGFSLTPARYSIRGMVRGPDGKELHDFPEAAQIIMNGDTTSEGPLRVETRLTVVS